MERPVIEANVAARLKRFPKGSVVFADDFRDYGSQDSVKKALLRLNDKGYLVRLAHGIYLHPKVDKELGVLVPSTEEIAQAIARRDRAKIVPTGVQAMNKLGLSTQIPLKAVYLTDGAARTVKIGKRTITFKKTSPKNLLAKGEISSLVIQALKTMGQREVDDIALSKLYPLLKKESKENILYDAKLAPAWIHKLLMQAIQ